MAPEFYMHLHSMQIQDGKMGWLLLGLYFAGIIFPCWLVVRKCHKDAGSFMWPCVRPGPDHQHMAPALLSHLHANNYENKPDPFGRQNSQVYKNYFRQVMDNDSKPQVVKYINRHGFSF